MSNKILFIFEGEKTEKQITDNLIKFYISENSVIQCAYCTDIYRLFKEIDSDKDLDTFLLIKEKNQEILSEYSRDDFAEIYMFFDYDGHAPTAEDDKIVEVLNFFDNETEKGKLFVSYPMVESLKHFSKTINFKELKVKAKKNIKYKNLVSQEASSNLINFTIYTKEKWVSLIKVHLMKSNYILTDNYSLPNDITNQIDIFNKQLEKYIKIDSTVGVLSSFPLFLFDYYGTKLLDDLK